MLYIQKELIKDIDDLLKLVDKYKDEFDNKFIFIRLSDVKKFNNSIFSQIYEKLSSTPLICFSELYGSILNDMRNHILNNFAEFVTEYRLYMHYIIESVTFYTIMANTEPRYFYYKYINASANNDSLSLVKQNKPLFGGDPDLGIFFLAFTKIINSISEKIKKVYKNVNNFSENLSRDILSSSVNLCNDEELNEYFNSICEFAKNYKKEGN